MRTIFGFILCGSILLLANCTAKNAEVIVINKESIVEEQRRYQILAEEICICTYDLIDLLKDLDNIPLNEKKSMENEMRIALNGEAIKAEECMKKLSEERGELEINQEMSEAALRQYCPNFYSMLKVGRIKY